ncbi:Ger(x)C family spore germination protein [Paenibacillus hamazuiensis]|uniref:Ger(x)C family spore germination protein n=1 Tax=Paenibacillus hamazuiensis TaxID=2936508 RepID=UPI00200D22E1|nr:Ger(x)C family spore germination protein [Paenibacillus hamazuiensis]
MTKKVCKLMAMLLMSLSLCACGGFKDIDKRFFVVAIAIDEPVNKDKKYRVTVRLAIPSPEEKFGANSSIFVTEERDSIAEAVRIIKSKIDKELDFGHAKALIIGESIVKSRNMKEVMDWFIRRRDIQQVGWLAVGSPNASDVIHAEPKSERLPSNMVYLLFGQTGTETAYIVSEYLFDFYRRLTERGLDPIMPIIEPRGQNQLSVNKVALFDKTKQVLVLQPSETKILNTFYQGIGKFDIRVEQDDHYFVVSAETVKSRFTIKRTAYGKPLISIKMKVVGFVEETDMTELTRKKIPELEKAAGQTVTAQALQLLKKLQKARVDPVGFGLRYRATHFDTDEAWREWQELYPDAEFEVFPDINITSTGVIG